MCRQLDMLMAHLSVLCMVLWGPWNMLTVLFCFVFFGYANDLLYPDSKVHGAYMGPTWSRQDPGGPHVGPINLAIRVFVKLAVFIRGNHQGFCWYLSLKPYKLIALALNLRVIYRGVSPQQLSCLPCLLYKLAWLPLKWCYLLAVSLTYTFYEILPSIIHCPPHPVDIYDVVRWYLEVILLWFRAILTLKMPWGLPIFHLAKHLKLTFCVDVVSRGTQQMS